MFLCCIFNSYATEPVVFRHRTKSVAFYYDNKWSPEGDYKAVVTAYKNRIVLKSNNGEGVFQIGKVDMKTSQSGINSLFFECYNEKSKECTIEFTYVEDIGSPCMYIRFPAHIVRYILNSDDEY